MLACAVAAAWAQSAGEAGPALQNPQTVFRATSRLVNITVIARDKKGRPVTDLRAADFEVIDNGRPQTLRSFEAAFARAVAASNTRTGLGQGADSGVAPATFERQPRYIVFAIDNSSTGFTNRQRALAAVHQWLDSRKTADDLFAVAVLNQRADFEQTFTSDRDALLAATRRAMASETAASSASEYNRLITGMNGCLQMRVTMEHPEVIRGCLEGEAHAFSQTERTKLRQSVSALEGLVHYLEPFPGDKRIVYLGDGFYINPGEIAYKAFISYLGDEPAFRGDLVTSNEHLFDSLEQTSVLIDTIDAGGLETPPEADTSLTVPTTIGGTAAPGANALFHGPLAVHQLNTEQVEQKHAALTRMAADTGGHYYGDSNDLGIAVQQSVGDMQGVYYASYVPTWKKLDGRYHELFVRVKRPGITVRTRNGYRAVPIRPLPVNVSVYPAQASAATYLVPVRCKFLSDAMAWHGHGKAKVDPIMVVRTLKRWPDQTVFTHAEVWGAESDLKGEVKYAIDLNLVPGNYTYSLRFTELATGDFAVMDLPISIRQ